MEPLKEKNLAAFRQLVDGVVLPTVSDAADVESAMTKTETGYIYEIRYKQPGVNFLADAVTINAVYANLEHFISLDKIREFMEGVSIHLGRLADKLESK